MDVFSFPGQYLEGLLHLHIECQAEIQHKLVANESPHLCETQWVDGPPFVPKEQKFTCQLNANLPFCCLSPQAMSILLNETEQGLFFGSGDKHGTAWSHLSSPPLQNRLASSHKPVGESALAQPSTRLCPGIILGQNCTGEHATN